MSLAKRRQQRAKPIRAAGGRAELAGIGPALGHDGHRLAAPDQLGAAGAKMPPTAEQRVGRQAVVGSVPALHRMDAPAVADPLAADVDRRGQRRAVGGRKRGVVERDRSGQHRQVLPEVGGRAKPGDPRECLWHVAMSS